MEYFSAKKKKKELQNWEKTWRNLNAYILLSKRSQSEQVYSAWFQLMTFWKRKNYGAITSRQIDGETVETVSDFIFGGSKILQMVTVAMKLKDTYSLEEKLWPT